MNTIDFYEFFDQALCGYVITDPDGKIIKVNKTIAHWLGCSVDNLLGKQSYELLSIGGRIYYETHLWPLLRMQGYFDEVALELIGKDQEKLPVLMNALERKGPDGRPLHTWLTIFKAADRRIYEQNLKHAKTSLETSLANALEVTTLREQFIAILGHDLRNPLSSIITGSSLLGNSVLAPMEAGLVQLINRSALRMAELINNIMDFARTRLGEGIILNPQSIQLEPVLLQVVDEIRISYPKRQIDTSFNLKEKVLCDGNRIAQLLSNLVANAITHGSADTPVKVTAIAGNNQFEMSVCNAGVQIPPEHIPRLFEPFTRELDRPSQQGLGLGLYISSQIAKAHKGELTATSTPDETCFSFRL